MSAAADLLASPFALALILITLGVALVVDHIERRLP